MKEEVFYEGGKGIVDSDDLILPVSELTSQMEDLVNENNKMKCDFCQKEFFIEDLDMFRIKNNDEEEKLWVCRECEEELEEEREYDENKNNEKEVNIKNGKI